jgi:SAM-dependent methyltransferase
MTLAPEEVKACCAGVYSSAAARFLLGDSFHPGGAKLTSHLIAALRVGPGDSVVDVACGPGASALQLANECGCEVIGVDLVVPETSPDARVQFLQGDAEALPLGTASVDGGLCECALCTFPDKTTAVHELARVLRPGGRVAIADVVAERRRLPEQLLGLDSWVACIADARPLDELAELLKAAGFELEQMERHDAELAQLLDGIEARLRLGRLLVGEQLGGGVRRVSALLAAARSALESGALGYATLVAHRPLTTGQAFNTTQTQTLRPTGVA